MFNINIHVEDDICPEGVLVVGCLLQAPIEALVHSGRTVVIEAHDPANPPSAAKRWLGETVLREAMATR